MAVEIIINKDVCKKCGICAEFCPKGVFEGKPGYSPKVVKPEECIECKLCELRCPDFAIEVRGEDKDE